MENLYVVMEGDGREIMALERRIEAIDGKQDTRVKIRPPQTLEPSDSAPEMEVPGDAGPSERIQVAWNPGV